jgi:predicted transcriptional regulator of viral defense system
MSASLVFADIMEHRDSLTEELLKLAKNVPLLRAADVVRRGIPRVYLTRLVRAGVLVSASRGVYRINETGVSENHSLAVVALRVPQGVICLLSALRFHGLTTQIPFEVWLAIDRKARPPQFDHPALHLVRFSSQDRVEGVDWHVIEGVEVPITNPARTVVDCFAYRNTLGIDVAMEALRDCLQRRLATPDELDRAARLRRMSRVMRPYLEAILS